MQEPTLTVYNLPPQHLQWDRVGVFYMCFCTIWTTIVLAGMIFCWVNRHLPILRIRGLGLSFASVICLHLYWILGQITYPVGPTLNAVVAYDVQYFVMGIYLPIGIALFHIANHRFLRVARLQQQFMDPSFSGKRSPAVPDASVLYMLRSLKAGSKATVYVTIGLIVQTLLTIGMWLACRKYHPAFGLPDTEIRGASVVEQLRNLAIGWEWWPSIVWQFAWTWIVAPVLIWRAWKIRDTMGWRTQTIGACLSGLHATPMFLVASYSPAFYKINAYFPPSQWIQLNTVLLEMFLVFVPAYQVVKLRRTNRKVMYSNEKWESSSQATIICTSKDKALIELAVTGQSVRPAIMNGYHGDRLLTMTALNRVLEHHPEPLQAFSACHDFSGENIAFLTRVAKWKATWASCTTLDHEQRIDMYNAALGIYIDFVSPYDAEFPLNLSSAQLKQLDDVFGASARLLNGHVHGDPALPFACDVASTISIPSLRHSEGSETELRGRYRGEIAHAFDVGVFDGAQSHVKDLVLTNTWPKFVHHVRRRSIDSDVTAATDDSNETAVSRVTRFVKALA
ncbi:hypothetical protein ACEQ8H_005425 [Pleosporales sp. CAS-2024a]